MERSHRGPETPDTFEFELTRQGVKRYIGRICKNGEPQALCEVTKTYPLE